MYQPSYFQLYEEGKLRKRVEKASQLLKECRLCPRNCAVDRLADKKGVCQTGRRAKIASYNAHFGEEAPLVGRFGSGTIFFPFVISAVLFVRTMRSVILVME